ncbi:hypothetical protein ACIGXM_29910 [Kitasatospora sp. NPDC052896]|uniref:hypothetical protein n=1 Tax=Kitasatospora sp. NPDC052896 TaxID=3364061 RepID=UPI0037C8A023
MTCSLPHLARPIAVSAALLALTTACAGTPATPPVPTAPAPTAAPSAPGAPAPAMPGSLSAQASGVDLAISVATVHVAPDGTAELTMTVRNSGSVPEHLAMVTTPDGSQATLQNAAGDTTGSLSDAGILLSPGSTTAFGGRGPHVLLHGGHPAPGQLIQLTMEFGVVGLVHLHAPAVAG